LGGLCIECGERERKRANNAISSNRNLQLKPRVINYEREAIDRKMDRIHERAIQAINEDPQAKAGNKQLRKLEKKHGRELKRQQRHERIMDKMHRELGS
jgi:hypothetical protein